MPRRADSLLEAARLRLGRSRFRPSRREAVHLLAACLGTDEASVLAHPERELAEDQARRYREWIERRAAGEPYAYIVGEREFWGRPFRVDPRVLIPRPETEHLVEAVLERAPRGARVLDLGTGSGCIAVSLALERADLRVVASDRSPAALALARSNAARLDASCCLVAADLLGGLDPRAFDVVVSNPPYVGTEEAGSLSEEILEHEPHEALFAGPRGLDIVERLLAGLAADPPRLLALEIGAGQAEALRRRASLYHFSMRELLTDHAGHDRVALLEPEAPRS